MLLRVLIRLAGVHKDTFLTRFITRNLSSNILHFSEIDLKCSIAKYYTQAL